MFLFMDTPTMIEESLKLIWSENHVTYTGQHFIDKLNNREKQEIIDIVLQTTLGDKMKYLTFDKTGKVI